MSAALNTDKWSRLCGAERGAHGVDYATIRRHISPPTPHQCSELSCESGVDYIATRVVPSGARNRLRAAAQVINSPVEGRKAHPMP